MFNPKKSFFELPVVRWAIGIHVVIAAASALAILITGDYGFSPTADGFNNFLHDFKFPIGVLAMLIPVMALLATNHKSEQAREEIKAAESHNNFVNYYKHIEEFEKFSDEIGVKDFNHREFHRIVFSNARKGDFRVGSDIKGFLDNISVHLKHEIKSYISEKNPDKTSELVISIEAISLNVQNHFFIKSELSECPDFLESVFNRNDDKPDGLYIPIKMLIDQVVLVEKLLKFDIEYVRSDEVEAILGEFFSGEIDKACHIAASAESDIAI